MGLCLTLGNEMYKETRADKARSFMAPWWRAAPWLAVSGYRAMGLVSGFSLAHRSDLGSFLWHTHRSVKMDSSEKDSGRLVGHMDGRLLSPFDLS